MITKFKTKKEKKAKTKLFGNKIKDILIEIEMSQQELADITNLTPAHLSRIINGQRQCISLPIAFKISIALKRPIEQIFQLTEK